MNSPEIRSGLVAVLGRTNVGKSSLINALVGEKVSIVTHKVQTTRHRAVGVLTAGDCQIGLVDTPGLHRGRRSALNRVMNETAEHSREGVDAVLLVVEAGRWNADDERALDVARGARLPVGLAVNKVDRVADKARLLPYVQACAERFDFAFVVPVSARSGQNLDALTDELRALMSPGEFLFPADEYTDRSLRFVAAETVREKLTLMLHQELPYSLAVTVERCEEGDDRLEIDATIWAARRGHKAIVIGRGGGVLKEIGRRARLELVRRLDRRVHLRLWVKVREDWIDDEAAVRGFES